MELLCKLRKMTYFFIDGLSGSVVRKTYNNLKKLDRLESNSKELSDYQETALKNILAHAMETTEFYSKYKGEKLTELPVINKEIIKKEQSNFLSTNYPKDKLLTMYTSGSTGTPFCCYQDKNKKKHVTAELMYYSEKAGYSLGDRLFQVAGRNEHNYRSKFRQWVRNHSLVLVDKLDDKNIERIIENINFSEKSTFLGYASTYDSLKEYFDRNGDSVVKKNRIKGIISNGQMLFDDVRESMEKAFNCKCYSRYSNEENGILGIDGIKNNVFVLNEAHYIIEVLEMNSDKRVEDGRVGRIVLTDLFNYAMPIIRYDTGDIGSITYIEVDGVRKRAVENFGGRKMDMIYDTKGSMVYPHVIAEYFEGFPEIRQFQIIQKESKLYKIRLSIAGKFEKNNELKKILKRILGKNAQITVEAVDEIPILSSGKRKMMINEMERRL